MDISFESFSKLVACLGSPPKYKSPTTGQFLPLSPSKIFASWLNHLPSPLCAGSGKHIFRLLFPHEGSRRRYGLKESKLAVELERSLCVKGLTRWDGVNWDTSGDGGSGCLGKEVEIMMRERRSAESDGTKSKLSIREVDSLLDELASHSPFSQLSQAVSNAGVQSEIIAKLYRESSLSPYALAVLTQIILRDLRPLLTPLPRLRLKNPAAWLKVKPKTGPAELSLYDALYRWDPRMLELYKSGRGSIDSCSDLLERTGGRTISAGDSAMEVITLGPVLGINIPIPKCMKGRSVRDALNEFYTSESKPSAEIVWAETKYDGYRMQIHVEVPRCGEPIITVFSKSKRNSTVDRLNTHAIILAALGLPISANLPQHPSLSGRVRGSSHSARKPCRSVILEAEVVPYNEDQREGRRGPGIEEFWWLEAAGVNYQYMPGQKQNACLPIIRYDSRTRRSRHLCLVFFDILLLNGENLLNQRYEDRRHLLEENITVIPGFSLVAERTLIPLHNKQIGMNALQRAFDSSNEARQEGLVLKAASSSYNNMQWRWVKLKKDYIPDLGDCIDLVILGAGWDIDRARELRVDTSVFTTFFVGVLTNLDKVKARRETPHFEILFRASYGMDRDQLAIYNENIRYGQWKTKPFDRDDPFKRRLLGLSWTYSLPRGMKPPAVLFESPLCGEVMGAGFQKLPSSDLYELRWPRLQKIYNPSERSWIDAMTTPDLIDAAHKSLGYASPNPLSSPENDSIRALWRRSVSQAALTDIPDSPSPVSPMQTKDPRPSPRRYQSAPMILKSSPPTPVSSRMVTVDTERLVTVAKLQAITQFEDPENCLRTPPPSSALKRYGSILSEEISDVKRQRKGHDIPSPSTPLFTPIRHYDADRDSLNLPQSGPSRSIYRSSILSPVEPTNRLLPSIPLSQETIEERLGPKGAVAGRILDCHKKYSKSVNYGISGRSMKALSLRSRIRKACQRISVRS